MSILPRAILCTFAASVLFLSGLNSANAQQVFGRIFGTVTDASGGAVQNAKVTITDLSKGTQSQVTTNESGNYDKGQLIPGTYSLTVEAVGFAKQQFNTVNVLVDAAARIDATLQPGNVATTVEVTAAAPTLQADRADVQTTFTSQQLIDLPSLGRNAQAMELLTPGASRIGFAHASSEDPQGSVQISVNGQHFSATGFQLDGTENQDPILGIVVINPNLDALSEQKIASQDYDAEFGYVGAGIANSSTKSGTNSWHGSAFDYIRNNSPGFTTFARDPFAEPNGAPVFKQNQFGGSIGGKLIKDKLFFFADAELIRQRQNGAVQTTVPTALARTGNFSEYLGSVVPGVNVTDTLGNVIPLRQNMIFDPNSARLRDGTLDLTGTTPRVAFANNTIPVSRLSPQALNVLNYFPQPNLNVSNPLLPNYAASGGVAFDANKWDTREDYYMNENTQIFGRYSNHQFEKGAVGAFGNIGGGPAFNGVNFAGNSFSRDQSIAFGITHTFSPTLVNEFRFGYMKYYVNVTPNGVGQKLADQLGIPGLNTDSYYTTGLPYFNFQKSSSTDQLTSLGYSLGANQCNCPLTENEQQYQFTDNVSKIWGNHTFKVGADIRYATNLRVPSDNHRAGELNFNSDNTGYVTGGKAQQGLSFATFMLGDVTTFNRYVSTSTNATERQRRWFFYGQDSWRVNSKLTVNYGLRWEAVFPEQVNASGNGAQLDLRTGLINVFGLGNVSVHGVQNMNYANFAPRLGIAYQLTPKTVIRTGYGWAYSLGTFGATFGHNVTQNPPVLFNQQPPNPNGNSFNTIFTLAQGAPSAAGLFPTDTSAYLSSGQFPLPAGVGAKARPEDVRLPRVMAYNFTVERQLFAHTSLSVGYVGNAGRHVSSGSGNGYDSNVNTPLFNPIFASNQNLAKPYYTKYGWTQGISFYCMCLNNQYNSLQVQLKRATAGGYGVQASYTYQVAKAVAGDDYSIYHDRSLAWGQQDSLPNHELTIAQNYDIPFGRGRKYGANMNKAINWALGGWNISGVTIFYGGLPFTPTLSDTGTSVRPYTGPGTRPDIGNGDAYATDQNRDHWLNVGAGGALSGAFAIPASNTFGNYGQNTLRGPIFIDQDVSLVKAFHITERARWSLRGEAYNVFNHTNLGVPNSNVNGSNAGVITATAFSSNMRRLQLAARFDF